MPYPPPHTTALLGYLLLCAGSWLAGCRQQVAPSASADSSSSDTVALSARPSVPLEPPSATETTEQPPTGGTSSLRPAAIRFEHTDHSFGSVTQGTIVRHRFKFTNTGQQPLDLQQVTASCGCTQPEYPFMPIPGGQSGHVDVSFDTGTKQGETTATITVITNATPSTHQLYLRGNVLPKPDSTLQH